MTILFMDGFDWTSTVSDLNRRWDYVGGLITISSPGRSGSGNYMDMYYTYMQKIIPSGLQTTLAIGIGLKTSDPWYDQRILIMEDESGVAQCYLEITNTGAINIRRGAPTGTTIATSDTGIITLSSWNYIEWKLTISDTVGVVVVNLNGSEVINETALDTRNASDYIGKIRITTEAYTYHIYWDDFYITTGEFLGDGYIKTYFPTSDGTHTDFTRSGGSNNYEMVDETDPDDDTTYNEANLLGAKDSYGFTPSITGNVKAVQVGSMVRKTGTQTVRIKNLIRSGGSDYNSTVEKTLSTSYEVLTSLHATDPADSNPWTQSKISSAEFGLEITAISTTTTTT